MSNNFKKHPAYLYAIGATNRDFVTNKDIYRVCEIFLEDLEKNENEDYEFWFDYRFAELITEMAKLINMASGIKVGKSVHDSLAPFQWFFIINALCWKHRDNHEKRRYEQSVLLVARKAGKTFLIALLFILLLLLEPKYSEFYSVAPDRELSSIIKKEMEQIISSSPAISKYFKIVRGEIRCLLTDSKFVPLATSENRMDGRFCPFKWKHLESTEQNRKNSLSCFTF